MKRLLNSLLIVLPALALTLLPLGCQNGSDEGGDAAPYFATRDEIPEAYTWDLTYIFPDLAAFEEAYAALQARIEDFSRYRGRLDQSPELLSDALRARFSLEEQFAELEVYANQLRDLDTRDEEANEMYQRVNQLGAHLDQALAFVEPEITRIPASRLHRWMTTADLEPYEHYLANLVRLQPHVRSAEIEQLLAAAGPMADAPQQAWSNMVSADIEWPTIRMEGEEKKVVPALYYSFVGNQDRRVRREAALKLFGTYSRFANTFAATYNGHIQRDIFFADARKYPTTLAMTLDQVNVPVAIVENLVSTVHDNVELLHRYAALRKRVLGLDEFHAYDLYVPLVAEAQKSYTFDEAWVIALDFWEQTYGEEYATVARRAFDERWIDVFAGEGKRGGAYSWGTYNSVPYLLLNWGGTLEDVFTLVHEMGHSIHTYLASEHQPFHYADYSLFVAEVASVASEALFFEYMYERAGTDAARLDLLNLYLNNITGTFVRQIFFHEFEARAHELARTGGAVTRQSLGGIYEELWRTYYGPELVLDEEFRAGWARVSHFYRTFYVYVYASSFAAGEAIAERFRSGDTEGAVEGYLEMLKLGGSVYPMDALARAGVNMNDAEVIRTVMKRYEETLSEMERLFAERR